MPTYKTLETYRGVAYPWSIDQMGHMNVASYTARFDEETWHFLAHLGLTPSFLKANNRGAVGCGSRTGIFASDGNCRSGIRRARRSGGIAGQRFRDRNAVRG